MEITPQVAQTMIESRFHEYPEMGAVAAAEHFDETLKEILSFKEIDTSFLTAIKNEVTVVLTLYAPLHDLAQNIHETTNIPLETSEEIASLIETLLLQPVENDLLAYSYLWKEELKKESTFPHANTQTREKLELRPEGVPKVFDRVIPEPGARPLTREEVLRTIAPQRTLASDIASLKNDATENS